jgi:cytoskeleton protein RodZ
MSSSQYNLIDPPDSAPLIVVNSVEELVAKRSAVGMSIETLAQQLRLPVKQIRQVESGEFGEMSSLALARAVVKSYAKSLGVDASPILASIGHFAEAADLKSSSTVHQPVESRGMLGFGQAGSGSKWVWGLLVVAALGILAFYFGPQQKDLQGLTSKLGMQAKPATNTTSTPVDVILAPSGVAVAHGGSGATGGVTSGVTGGATGVAASATEAVLKFDMQRPSWVEITQVVNGSDSTQILTHSGTDVQSYTLTVKLPAAIAIGNADAVLVSRDGNPLDLKPMTEANLAKTTIK